MLRIKSLLLGGATALAIGLTGFVGSPALAHDGDHHDGRGHEWHGPHWHPGYYHQHYWVGPGYYWRPWGWVYYDAPFAAYAPAPAYAPYPPAAPGVNVVVPLRIH